MSPYNDEQLKKWLKHAHQDVEIPDGSQSWLEIKTRLAAAKKRRRWIRRLTTSSVIACITLILSFVGSMDIPTADSHFTGLVKKAQKNIVHIFFQEHAEDQGKNPGANTPPPPPGNEAEQSGEGSRAEDMSLEEARQKLRFHLAVPAYVPKGYDLDIVRIYRDNDGEYRTVFMEYVNHEGRIIQLNQRLLRDEAAAEISTVHESSTIKDVMVNRIPGVLITHDNDFRQLEWLTAENIKQSLFGLLSEREILSMAESMQ